jgi:hypothetical protein
MQYPQYDTFTHCKVQTAKYLDRRSQNSLILETAAKMVA